MSIKGADKEIVVPMCLEMLLDYELDTEAVELLLNADDCPAIRVEIPAVLEQYARQRNKSKNWRGLFVLLSEVIRREPDCMERRDIKRLYRKACRKTKNQGVDPRDHGSASELDHHAR